MGISGTWGQPGHGQANSIERLYILLDGEGLDNINFIETEDNPNTTSGKLEKRFENSARMNVLSYSLPQTEIPAEALYSQDYLIYVNIDDDSNVGFDQEVYSLDDVEPGSEEKIQLKNSSQGVYKRAYFVVYDHNNRANKVSDLSQIDSTPTNEDIIFANTGEGDDRLGEGNDTINAGLGGDIVFGREGDDYIRGEEGRDALIGGKGNDSLYGDSSNDSLDGGSGNDILDGGEGADILEGGYGNDTYIVDIADDEIIDSPRTGIDTVKSSVSLDLREDTGLDFLYLKGNALNGTGNYVDNKIYGNNRNNRLIGKGGNDTLTGGNGKDTLIGGTGNDSLIGGNGKDTLIGGTGNDTYMFESPSHGIDEIRNFSQDEGDKIQISREGFGISNNDISQFSYNNGELYFGETQIATFTIDVFIDVLGTTITPKSDVGFDISQDIIFI